MFEMIVFRAMLAARHHEQAFQPRYRYGEHETMARARPEAEPAAAARPSAVILPFRRPLRLKSRSTTTRD